MEIALHIGATCTDNDRLLKSLLRNVGRLSREGVAVPGPSGYRAALREAALAAAGGGEPGGLLESVLKGRQARRVVLSSSAFLALPGEVMEGGFLARARERARALPLLFPGARVELFLGLRNPATLLPAAWGQARGPSFDAFMGGADPRAPRWSAVVEALRRSAPDAPLTVWCNEDTPLVWGEVMAALAGVPEASLEGRWDLLAAIMSPEGFDRFSAYMAEHPGGSALQERRVIGAFLDKFALDSEIEDVVDVPGWDDALVRELTEAYEADVARIAARGDVRVIQA